MRVRDRPGALGGGTGCVSTAAFARRRGSRYTRRDCGRRHVLYGASAARGHAMLCAASQVGVSKWLKKLETHFYETGFELDDVGVLVNGSGWGVGYTKVGVEHVGGAGVQNHTLTLGQTWRAEPPTHPLTHVHVSFPGSMLSIC